MRKIVGFALLVLGTAGYAMAGGGGRVPEVNATTAAGALTLVSGAILVLRSRRRK